MKKKLLAGALALAILTGGTLLASAGSQAQVLVSLSYLTGTFWNDLKSTVKQEVDRDTTFILNEAVAQAGQNGSVSGFAVRTGANGDVIAGTTGSGLIWTSGNGMVRAGTLVDTTEGVEMRVGGALTPGHRYLAGTDVTLVAASDSVQWMEEGQWTVTTGEPVDPPKFMPFTDVAQNAWYYDDVAYVYEHGLFDGVSSTSFSPSGKMQRCMMTTVLHRLAGKPRVSYTALFSDIPDGQWYTAGTVWAGQRGVVTGVGDSKFNPFANVTRQEIAVILYRYAQQTGYDVNQFADLSRFGDSGTVASWGREAISWAVSAGILNGNNGLLLPGGDATRAEVAAMLHRFVVWSGK